MGSRRNAAGAARRLCRSQAGGLRGGRGKGTTARHIGLHLDDWKVPMPDGRHWTVERDGSVTDPSAEVVSPVCRYSHLCRNRPIAQIPAPQRLNLLALLICQRYTNRSF